MELDVHLTADGEPVVIHDYDLARTTSGTGLVHERGYDYVRSLSAGAWYPGDFADERVPRLDEVLALGAAEYEIELKGTSDQKARGRRGGVRPERRGARSSRVHRKPPGRAVGTPLVSTELRWGS